MDCKLVENRIVFLNLELFSEQGVSAVASTTMRAGTSISWSAKFTRTPEA
jgi:hypothetical protein